MKQGWEIKNLGEIADVEYGFTDKSTEDGDFRYVRITDIDSNGVLISTDKKYLKYSKEAEGFLIRDNDLLMARTGATFAKVLLYQDFEPSVFASYLIRINFKEKIHNKLYWYFTKTKSYWEQANSLASGAAQPHFNGAAVKQVSFSYPKSLPEQQRIVSILDECFSVIERSRNNAEQNLKNAKELFESYLQGVFENKGEGWEEKSLGEVCEYDKTPHDKSDLPYVGLEDIQSNSGLFIGTFEPKGVKSTTFSFSNEHVLYGRLRTYLNKVLLPDFVGHCSTEIFPIKTKKNILDRTYLFHWLMAAETMKKINATWTGATLPRANMNAVLEFKLIVPPLKTQQTIVQKLDALNAETKKLEAIYQQKLNDLEELKKSILQKAFAGELKNKQDMANPKEGVND